MGGLGSFQLLLFVGNQVTKSGTRVSVQKQLEERTGASLAGTKVETYQARGNPSGAMKAEPVKPVTFSFERKACGSAGAGIIKSWTESHN